MSYLKVKVRIIDGDIETVISYLVSRADTPIRLLHKDSETEAMISYLPSRAEVPKLICEAIAALEVDSLGDGDVKYRHGAWYGRGGYGGEITCRWVMVDHWDDQANQDGYLDCARDFGLLKSGSDLLKTCESRGINLGQTLYCSEGTFISTDDS